MNRLVSVATSAGVDVETLIPAIAGAAFVMLLNAVKFFVVRAFTKSDKYGELIAANDGALRVEISKINQALGLLNAAKERAKEEDDSQKKSITSLQKEVQRLRERVAVLEASRCDS